MMGVYSDIFADGVDVYKFKAKESEIMQLHYIWVMFQNIFQFMMLK